jgi:small subunit ribosomal protein S4
MIRKKKKFELPKKSFEKQRIMEENKLVLRYGLKNKKEIFKAESKVKYLRNMAKKLITAEQEEQQRFFDKLNKIGLKVEKIADVLALSKEDLMNRRIATIIWKKGLSSSIKNARQMVCHKKIMIGESIVDSPSYLIKIEEEPLIQIKTKVKKPKEDKVVEKIEEVSVGDENGE